MLQNVRLRLLPLLTLLPTLLLTLLLTLSLSACAGLTALPDSPAVCTLARDRGYVLLWNLIGIDVRPADTAVMCPPGPAPTPSPAPMPLKATSATR